MNLIQISFIINASFNLIFSHEAEHFLLGERLSHSVGPDVKLSIYFILNFFRVIPSFALE